MSAKISNGVQLSVSFDEPLYRRLADEAKDAERSLNGEIRHRLRKSLEQTSDEQTA
jgi:hypothetical protein